MGSDDQNCGGCGVVCNGTCVNGVCQQQTSCTVDLGTCAHSGCVTGAALGDFCDPDETVFFVCEFDGLSSCCSSTWDQSCVDDFSFYEDCGGC
jgi:hypothetical protein